MKYVIALVIFTTSIISTEAQTKIGLGIGLDQHIAGGGPYFELNVKSKGFRLGLQLYTQVNAFTPYKFQRYDAYRYASNISQFFGGGMSFGYEFKSNSPQRVKPIIFYRGSYFNTGYLWMHLIDPDVSNDYFRSYSSKSFSTNQSISAGFTVDIVKGLQLDFTVGSGVYLFKDSNAGNGNNAGGHPVEIRPDFNANLSLAYFFGIK